MEIMAEQIITDNKFTSLREVKSNRPNPLRGFNYIACFYERDKSSLIATIGFNKISGIKKTTNVYEIKHTNPITGCTTTSKMPNDTVVSSPIFEKGSIPYNNNTKIDSPNKNIFLLYKKVNEVFDLPKKTFKKFDIIINLYNFHGYNRTLDSKKVYKPEKRWSIINAWVGEIEFGELDAQNSTILLDKFTIICDNINYDYTGEMNTGEIKFL